MKALVRVSGGQECSKKKRYKEMIFMVDRWLVIAGLVRL
jgi:hypothetical protein